MNLASHTTFTAAITIRQTVHEALHQDAADMLMDVDMEHPCRRPLSQSLQPGAGVTDSELASMGNGTSSS